MYETVKQFDVDGLKDISGGIIEIKETKSQHLYSCTCGDCTWDTILLPGKYNFKIVSWNREYLTIEVVAPHQYTGEYCLHEFEIYVNDEDCGYCTITDIKKWD